MQRLMDDVIFTDLIFEKSSNSVASKTENYSPSQPRDEKGRWTDGGSSSEPTISHYKALYDYQDYAYQDINDYLRLSAAKKAGKKLDEIDKKRYNELTSDKERLKDIKEHVKSIDSAFNDEKAKTGGFGHRIDTGIATELFMSTDIGDFVAKLKKDGNLPMNHEEWYGSKSEYGKQLEDKVVETLKGKNYTFRGYVSTDSERGGAFDRFASSNSKIEPTGMETYIQLSSSKVKTLRVNDFTGMDSYMGQENPENEVLFNRDSKFEIYSVSIVPSSAESYAGARGEGFQLHLYMKDASSNNSLEDKVENYSPTQPRDWRGRWIDTGVGTGPNGIYRGTSTKVNTVREFEKALKERNIGKVTIELGDEIIKGGHAQAILETLDRTPNVAREMIAGHKKKLDLEYKPYPHDERENRRYTRGMYNGKENRIRLFYDTQDPSKTTAKRVKTTLIHELMHVADYGKNTWSDNDKQGEYFRKYVDVSKMPHKERANYVDSLTHAVKNSREFYANTMTSFFTKNPTSQTNIFKTEMVPIIEGHIAEILDE